MKRDKRLQRKLWAAGVGWSHFLNEQTPEDRVIWKEAWSQYKTDAMNYQWGQGRMKYFAYPMKGWTPDVKFPEMSGLEEYNKKHGIKKK